ncbi:mutS domain II family protein, partial [Vibrio parahaemolyticus 12310]
SIPSEVGSVCCANR